MLDDQGEQPVWQCDAPTSGRGLHLDLDQAATIALRAPAGMADAVWRAGQRAFPLVPLAVLRARLDLVVASAATMRVSASVLPGLPLQALHDLQSFAGLVQARPFQPECLADPESSTRQKCKQDLVATFCPCNDLFDFRCGQEWLALLPFINDRKADEMEVPVPRIKLLSFARYS